MHTTADTKQALRQEMLARREAIPAATRLEAAQAIANHFADHPYLTYAGSFAGYYAMRGEVDVLPVFNRMARFHKRTALPAIHAPEQPLIFREWQPGVRLEAAAFGTKQPAADQPEFIPEVVLVPLLAFDAVGHRIGYGSGYYDRTIQALRAAQASPPWFIGTAFALQEVPHISAEESDQPLDGILTEEGVSVF